MLHRFSSYLLAAPRALRRMLADTQGAGAVEMALIAPMLLLMLVTFVDLGMAYHHRTSLESAARAGVQRAIIDYRDTAAIQATTTTALRDATGATVTVGTSLECGGVLVAAGVWCADGTFPATYVTVTVTQPVQTPLGFLDLATLLDADGVARVRVN
jgi:Flp pilus assembly protein TadG